MSKDIIIGAVYIMIGIFGFLENTLTAFLMSTDPHMKNPTYFYMINLCLVDGIMLLPLVLYSGMVLLVPQSGPPWAITLASFLAATCWHAGCALLVMTSFARYVQLVMSHKIPVYFTRRSMIISVVASWSVSALAQIPIFCAPERIFTFYPHLYAWEFDRDTTWGFVYFVGNQILINAAAVVLINLFNFLSLLSIRRRRKQIQHVDTSGNFKREIKLFVQCAISGGIFTGSTVLFFATNFMVKDDSLRYVYLCLQLVWAVHHAQHPVIYFAFNSRLRQRLFDVFRKKASITANH